MKKVVLKLELDDDKAKKKAMKTLSSLAGVDSISLDMKNKKVTVTGDIDPVHMVIELRRLCHAEILTVGPAKEPEKTKQESKKEELKKQEENKGPENEQSKQEENKKDQQKDKKEDPLPDYFKHYPHSWYYVRDPVEFSDENPNACVIS